ncbi:MAG TPA: glycoside hydrolase family 3 C-terminal domain-containing protein [Pyrinomonadaceae bacterium]|jgi:beta-glucosidase|nr:glycoside hydrolase family 3 C-terminal domain-containing protein [Pyrinomonadaceae bacterium]
MKRTIRQFLISLCLSSLLLTHARAQTHAAKDTAPDYMNPRLPFSRRAEDLVSRMTLEEKVAQMMNKAPAVERLGVPAYDWWNEALHGVAYAGDATVFPQAIALGATWDEGLIHAVADAISTEARAKYNDAVRRDFRKRFYGLTFWSPNINIFRDPRWGRGQETYGEDPYLTSRLGVAFVRGLQGDDPKYLKTVATPKHYAVHSGPESLRHTFDARPPERDLEDTYLPAFRAAVVEGRAGSVMCAYNRLNGEPLCASPRMLKEVLRGAWGFSGYVVSDCDAVADIYKKHNFRKTEEEGVAVAVRTGTDLTCGYEYRALPAALKQGLITEAEIDTAVRRLFEARFRLGMFDPPGSVPFARIPFEANDAPAHRELAARAARESIVLLKNDNNTLPLKKDLKSIAVIGPNADSLEVLLGNYNGIPSKWTTPLEGIRRKVSAATRVLGALGTTLTGDPVLPVPASAFYTDASKTTPGLKAEYFDNKDLQGPPAATRTDAQLNFDWYTNAPVPRLPTDKFSARWTGYFVPPSSGTYQLGARADDAVRVFLDDQTLVENWRDGSAKTVTKAVELEGGRAYKIRVEYYDNYANATAKLVWGPPNLNETLREEALKKARESDVVVMALGLAPSLEGEEMDVKVKGFSGGDRTDLNMPEAQEELLKSVVATGKPVVLVLVNGSALAVNWAQSNVPAIVEAWYPGEEGGNALADVLFGDYSPSGRLPVTFYKSADDLPPFEDYRMDGKTYRYFRGEPLYPFGHGLSYTRFEYGNLKLDSKSYSAAQSVRLSVDVKNVGAREGDEVVQLYVTDVAASAPVPVRALKGVRRIRLKPGERRRVNFTLTPRDLTLVDARGRRLLEPGEFRVSVGGKQPGFRGGADAPTTGVVTGGFNVTGKTVEIP